MRKRILLIFIDIVIVTLSFFLVAWLKPATKSVVIPGYFEPFLFFLAVWIAASIVTRKYYLEKYKSLRSIITIILIANFSVLAVVTVLMYLFNQFSYSRALVFGTLITATVLEIILAHLFNSVLRSPVIDQANGNGRYQFESMEAEIQQALPEDQSDGHINRQPVPDQILETILQEFGKEVHHLILEYAVQARGQLKVVSTSTRFNILSLSQPVYGMLVNLHRINDIQRINKFFESVNSKMSVGGLFIGKAETYSLRKARILKKYLFPFSYLYYSIDFVFKRIFPKVFGLKQVYFFLTRGKNRLLSRAETLGRLYSCGFRVLNEQYIDNELYFVAQKTKEPDFPKNPTYGPLVRLRRVGKDGQLFTVFKMRTMHPYAEYLQAYIYEKYQLQEGGKFNNDFRVNTVGRFIRKIWLDEVPMLINIMRGDMKIVGVRPLSRHYYNLYSDELKKMRIRHKPGLIPPFYADMPKTLEEIMASEMKYLEQYEKSPLKTDARYFFMAWRNILFKKARSN